MLSFSPIHASISSTVLGTIAKFSTPVFVIRTSSSMRTPPKVQKLFGNIKKIRIYVKN